mgnify:FL=1
MNENFLQAILQSIAWLLTRLLSVLTPLFIGLAIAYLLHPAVDWLTQKLRRRGLAILLTYLLAACFLGGLICGFVILILGALPQGSPREITTQIFAYFESAYQAADAYLSDFLPDGMPSPIAAGLEQLSESLERRFSVEAAVTFLSGLGNAMLHFFIGLVASVYLLKDRDFFYMLWERLLSVLLTQRAHGLLNENLSEINQVLSTFVKGAMIDSLIIAFLSSVVLTALQVDYAVIIGLLDGVLNIIPYFGPFFGMLPAFAVAAVTAGPLHGMFAVFGLFVVQQIDANYIYPKVVGGSTGLHPLFVLLSVSLFGSFFGIGGMLLAIPIAGIVQIFIKKWAFSR